MPELQPLIGEPLALDLVNTRPIFDGGSVDLIGSLEGLRLWLAMEAGRLPGFTSEEAGRLTLADLEPVLEVRDHTSALLEQVRHGGALPVAALGGLNEALRASPAVRTLAFEGDSFLSMRWRSGRPGVQLAACLADAAADLLCDPTCRDIRQCAAVDCAMLFMPTHPRRRWCSSARCGNRARVSRYYRRRKPE